MNSAQGGSADGGQLLKNFVTNIIDKDLAEGRNGGRIVTRFPPEPNGYLHLGHAKSISINFGLGSAYKGVTHMRFDDTNPAKEDMEYVNSILEDVRWLVGGTTNVDDPAPWFGDVRHTSDYFDTLYDAAEFLIKEGKAYVDELSPEQVREYRGTLTESGKDSPYRTRSIEENLQMFRDMRDGKYEDGKCVLRAKIDMTSANMNMRDPTLYRLKKADHPMTGNKWCIYPMYDYAHAMSDAIEGITHSLCTLEFADHRPLYDWTIDSILPSGLLPGSAEGWRPTQTEFSRLNLQYTVLSKRKLIQLVTEKHVSGWDDPRMPTLSGVRRRGYPPEAIRLFCDRMGISKAENNIDMSILEDCVRETLDSSAPRALVVVKPLKVTITNWPTDKTEIFTAERHPKRAELGTRDIPFSGSVFIDKDDFHDTGPNGDIKAPKGFKRLTPGGTVRLKFAYVVKCDEVIRDARGEAIELRCSYDESTRAGQSPEGAIRAKGIVQWVSEEHAVPIDVILYDRLFQTPSPGKDHEDGDFLKDINPESRTQYSALAEQCVADGQVGEAFQFERVGYFARDKDSNSLDSGKPIFNRVVTLRDTWATSARSKGDGKNKGNENQESVPDPKSIKDVLRIDMRVGKVIESEKHPDADSLYVSKIDIGEEEPRQIISGLADHIPLDTMAGRMVCVLCNLKPSKMRGIVSEGMILAASLPSPEGEGEVVELVAPPAAAQIGELIQIEGYDKPQPDVMLKSKSAQECWKRVALGLATDADNEATYTDTGPDGQQTQAKLMTSAGPCFVPSLSNAAIR